ncbi:hypothetical protein GBA52_016178 [Prunus armeniaca]|nr:hypothetical protein GBA52_016178 [Prunus armeniaca]
MGSGVSSLSSCFRPVHRTNHHHPDHNDVVFAASEPLDETLGHSFCYVRSSARFLSPTQSDRFISPSNSLRFSPSHEPGARTRPGLHETGFKAISGASVSANSSTPRTVLQLDNIYDDATDSVLGGFGGGVRGSIVNGFESTSSFSALPLQPVPRGGERDPSGPMERAGFFLSGPIERGALSGPLDPEPERAWTGRPGSLLGAARWPLREKEAEEGHFGDSEGVVPELLGEEAAALGGSGAQFRWTEGGPTAARGRGGAQD